MDPAPALPIFLTQREVAEVLRLPERMLEDWRQTRRGPPYVKLGHHVRYEQADLLAWVRERRHGQAPHRRRRARRHPQLTRLANGTWRARARARDDAGDLHQLRAVADTEEEARAEITRRAANLSSSGYIGLTASDTVADACTAWLAQVRVRAQAGALSFSTYESYEQTVRLLLVPRCGGITLGALTVGRCDRIIQAAFLEQSLSAARRVRPVLGLVCGYAARDDAIPFNPVRDVQPLSLSEKKTAVLTPPQIAGIRELVEHGRQDSGMGPRPNYRALIDGLDILLGTSARVGECIGLRRCDVDMTASPPTLLIDGTITQTRELGVRRKNAPKRTRQRRRIALPSMAAAAV